MDTIDNSKWEKLVRTLNAQRRETQAAKRREEKEREESERLEVELGTLLDAQRPVNPIVITPQNGSKSEGTAVLVASDWHIEEPVDPKTVNDKNAYDLVESERRARLFFADGLEKIRLSIRDKGVTNVLVALLGDFITNSIHEESAATNLLPPGEAVEQCGNYLGGGFDLLLAKLPRHISIVVPCHSGNHGRTTKKQYHATSEGNSLERMMYLNLAARYHNDPRIRFELSPAYHSFADCYGYTVRFHHGHDIRYGGGVGGITIPVNKAINQWNHTQSADIDVFGHFHQFLDGGNFIANGSMIGYNAYAVSIKAKFEPPKQAFFVIEKGKGKTRVEPILFT